MMVNGQKGECQHFLLGWDNGIINELKDWSAVKVVFDRSNFRADKKLLPLTEPYAKCK